MKVAPWSSVQTHNTGAMSFNPTRVTIKAPICEEGDGKPSHKIHLPKNHSELCLWSLLCLKSNVLLRSKERYLEKLALLTGQFLDSGYF